MVGYYLKSFLLPVLFMLTSISAKAAIPNDSIDSYTGHTVSDSVFVQGQSTISVNNVDVTSTGHLVVSAPNSIEIGSNFTVVLGGRLDLYREIVHYIVFTYDASGNVIRREENLLAR